MTSEVDVIYHQGTLVANLRTFLAGMHLVVVIAGGVLVLSLIVAWAFIAEQARNTAQEELVANSREISETAKEAV